jgi:4a-hydroxytetrahydrobiopterin dehydratase
MTSFTHPSRTPRQETKQPLDPKHIISLLSELQSGWQINPQGYLCHNYEFPDFMQALNFAQVIGQIAEKENHHPDLCLGWGYCRVTLWTHEIAGLSTRDFILASKIDAYTKAPS